MIYLFIHLGRFGDAFLAVLLGGDLDVLVVVAVVDLADDLNQFAEAATNPILHVHLIENTLKWVFCRATDAQGDKCTTDGWPDGQKVTVEVKIKR